MQKAIVASLVVKGLAIWRTQKHTNYQFIHFQELFVTFSKHQLRLEIE
jgi:hypothetical protein